MGSFRSFQRVKISARAVLQTSSKKSNVKHINHTRVKQFGCNSERIEGARARSSGGAACSSSDATQKELKGPCFSASCFRALRHSDATQKELKVTRGPLLVPALGYYDATKKELKGEVAGLFLGCGLACDNFVMSMYNFVIFVFLCLKNM